MNENPSPTTNVTPVAPINPVVPELFPRAKPFMYWVRRFLACNPFYLVSAALLLYGVYRVSIDPAFLSREAAQLFFNYTALQSYELLLVITAIFLVRRAVWYDSTLLAGLENLLVLVPFILVSEAAQVDKRLVWGLCLAAGVLVTGRFSALKRYSPALNLPKPLFGAGAILLAANVAMPIAYRILHQYKIGTRPDWGSAYQTNQYSWWLLLPALCTLTIWIPARRGGDLLPQRPWLPMGFFSLWLAGTGVHLYCLGYVYDFSLRPELLAPAVWTLLWMIDRRAADFIPDLKQTARRALWVPPLLATLLAAQQRSKWVFLILTALNVAIYGGLCLRYPGRQLARHLLLISLVAFIGGIPQEWGVRLTVDFSRANAVSAAAAIYCLIWTALSRNPKLGLLGAIVCTGAVAGLLGNRPDTGDWAAQGGLVFLLLHSFRWASPEEIGAKVLRISACIVWVAHAFIWMQLGGAAWIGIATAAPVLSLCLLARWLSGSWGPWVVPVSAVLVLVSGPGSSATATVHSLSTGLLAVAGSFLLFGIGTVAAVTKHRWNRHPQPIAQNPTADIKS